MKITKQRLEEIIREELDEVLKDLAGKGYVAIPGGLRWVGRDPEKFPSAASTKKMFLKLAAEQQLKLSPSARIRAMMWVDRNWQKMTSRAKAESEIKSYLKDITK